MKSSHDRLKSSTITYLSIATLILLLGTIFFTISRAVQEQRIRSNAAEVSPPYGGIFTCPGNPACPTSGPSQSPAEGSIAPTNSNTNPSVIQAPTGTITDPCASGASIATEKKKSKHKEHKGDISGFMEKLLKFFIELINLLLKLFGGSPIEIPNEGEPLPGPSQPSEPNPTTPNEQPQPTVAPCEPSAAPSNPMPSVPGPSQGVSPSTTVPSQGPSGTPGDPTAATCTNGSGGSLDYTGWTLVGCDDFNGTSVDTSKWGMYDGAGHGGNGRRSPGQATVSNGVLTITGTSDGTTAGMAWQNGQQYGRWEGRVRAAAGDPSYNALLLLWPDAEDWPVGGEVDFMEMLDETRQTTNFFLHYGADNSQVSGEVEIDGTQWHNWAVEWTPTAIIGYVDGREWFKSTDPNTLPPRAMHLTIQLDWFPEGGTVQQSSMEVDWIHIYSQNQ